MTFYVFLSCCTRFPEQWITAASDWIKTYVQVPVPFTHQNKYKIVDITGLATENWLKLFLKGDVRTRIWGKTVAERNRLINSVSR